MVARLRSRASGAHAPGTSIWTTTGFPPSNYSQSAASSGWPAKKVDVCSDVVGNRDSDNGLSIEHVVRDVYGINGLKSTLGGLSVRQYNNWMPPAVSDPISHLSLSPPSLNNAVTTLKARTNPGRTQMSLPVAIGELKDLPGMIRDGSRALARWLTSSRSLRDARRYRDTIHAAGGGAGVYLAYQFGIAPVISDIRKMLDFQAITERRFDELRRLYSGQGLKRRYTLFQNVVSEVANVTLASHMSELVDGTRTTITSGKMWGTIRWKPNNPLPSRIKNQDDLRRYARQVAFGMNRVTFQDAWNLMPWSWLIDWFSNTGEWLDANIGRIPATSSNINICYKRTTAKTWQMVGQPTYTMKPSLVTLTTLERTPHSGFTLPEANLGPSLTARQQSILGALAVTRHRFRGPR